MRSFRAAIHVIPGCRVDRVGGAWAGSGAGRPPALQVRVRARPVAGAATAAAEVVLADALGIRSRQVRVVRGAQARDKLVEVADPPLDLEQRWARLLGQ
jgi:uncharacterized protein YggU (UPF0235/DUF167 family)